MTAETETAAPVQGTLEHAMATGTLSSMWAQVQPDALAITSPSGTRTFAELDARANQVARALRAAGIAPGDGVALLCSNRPEFVEVLLGAQRCGVRLTPVNWHVTADEAAYIVSDSGARAFIADVRFTQAAAGAACATGTGALLLAVGGPIDGFADYDRVTASYDADHLPDPALGTTMLYTSGTTGRPKGVHRLPGTASLGSVSVLTALAQASQFQAGRDVSLVTGPLYHAAPLAFSLGVPLASGVGVVLMDGWDAELTLQLVERHRVTHTHMVPTMFHRLLSLPPAVRQRYDLSSLRLVWHGAAPCPAAVKQDVLDWLGPIVWEYYGATEGLTTVVTPEQWLARPGTVGRPEDDQVRILDDAGEELPRGATGTIYIKAPEAGRFQYFRDSEKTQGAYRGDHYTLGDVGHLDEDGWLFLTDRSSELIISGGVNIYPAEVEGALLAHPAVGDVAVIGIPNSEWGEEVKAVVELQPGVRTSAALVLELMEFTRARLAAYKCPRSVDVVDQLPRADNGKLYKRRLREEYRSRVGTGTS